MSYSYLSKIPFKEIDYVTTGVSPSEHAAWDEDVTIELYVNEGVVTGFGVSKITTW